MEKLTKIANMISSISGELREEEEEIKKQFDDFHKMRSLICADLGIVSWSPDAEIVEASKKAKSELDVARDRIAYLERWRGAPMASDRAETIERELVAAEDAVGTLRGAAREAGEILIREIGAPSPEGIVETATRAAQIIVELKDEVEGKKRSLQILNGELDAALAKLRRVEEVIS